MFDGRQFADEVVQAVRDHVARAVKPLEARIAELEAQSGGGFAGVFQLSQAYRRGVFVTCDSALWFATRDIDAGEAKPGAGATGWQLVVKSPR
jgi:hypothetical protein